MLTTANTGSNIVGLSQDTLVIAHDVSGINKKKNVIMIFLVNSSQKNKLAFIHIHQIYFFLEKYDLCFEASDIFFTQDQKIEVDVLNIPVGNDSYMLKGVVLLLEKEKRNNFKSVIVSRLDHQINFISTMF